VLADGPMAEVQATRASWRSTSVSDAMLATEKLNQFYGGSHTLWDIDLEIPTAAASA
jgi:hypothetical protein